MTIDQPPQRRDNGLPAERFVALADVDPRLGDHLLDLLRLADIPAYLEPPPDLRAGRWRDTGPLERLWVHADQRQDAREVVVAAAHEAGTAPTSNPASGASSAGGASEPPRGPDPARPDLLAGLDPDVEFARMTAAFDAEVSEPGAAPASSVDAEPGERPGDELDAAASRRISRLGDDADVGDQGFPHDVTSDPVPAEEHFEPPPPPPFPVPTAGTLGAFAVFFLGLLVIARGNWLGFTSDVSFPIGLITLLTGVGLLVARLRESRAPEEDGDDGAVL